MRNSSAVLRFSSIFEGEQPVGSQYTAVFNGFVHPSVPSGLSLANVSVFLEAANAKCELFLSRNNDPNSKVPNVLNIYFLGIARSPWGS